MVGLWRVHTIRLKLPIFHFQRFCKITCCKKSYNLSPFCDNLKPGSFGIYGLPSLLQEKSFNQFIFTIFYFTVLHFTSVWWFFAVFTFIAPGVNFNQFTFNKHLKNEANLNIQVHRTSWSPVLGQAYPTTIEIHHVSTKFSSWPHHDGLTLTISCCTLEPLHYHPQQISRHAASDPSTCTQPAGAPLAQTRPQSTSTWSFCNIGRLKS